MEIATVGIDLAKNVFQILATDRRGRTALKKRVRREQLLPLVANLPTCVIGIEACAGAFHWARQFQAVGHTVRIISPQFVKPLVKGNKNDSNDAAAICEAIQRPHMRFVPMKSVEQQDVQALHRARQRLVNHRTALICQMRGLLMERGIVFGQSAARARRLIPMILADQANDLTPLARETLSSLFDFLRQIDERIREFDQRIDRVFRQSEVCQRIARVEGVGPKTATAMVAAVGDARDFKNGRHMAAWLGLVPRHRASGDRITMGSITKHGDQHLRTLLVHGARAVVRTAKRKTDPKSVWVNTLVERRGTNRAIVAVANKNARVLWALLARGLEYRQAA